MGALNISDTFYLSLFPGLCHHSLTLYSTSIIFLLNSNLILYKMSVVVHCTMYIMTDQSNNLYLKKYNGKLSLQEKLYILCEDVQLYYSHHQCSSENVRMFPDRLLVSQTESISLHSYNISIVTVYCVICISYYEF